jgi:hypothetical protein
VSWESESCELVTDWRQYKMYIALDLNLAHWRRSELYYERAEVEPLTSGTPEASNWCATGS